MRTPEETEEYRRMSGVPLIGPMSADLRGNPNAKSKPCPKCGEGELHFFIILGENKVKHHTHNRFCDTCSYAENRRGLEIYSQRIPREK